MSHRIWRPTDDVVPPSTLPAEILPPVDAVDNPPVTLNNLCEYLQVKQGSKEKFRLQIWLPEKSDPPTTLSNPVILKVPCINLFCVYLTLSSDSSARHSTVRLQKVVVFGFREKVRFSAICFACSAALPSAFKPKNCRDASLLYSGFG